LRVLICPSDKILERQSAFNFTFVCEQLEMLTEVLSTGSE
jgi:hypothetical protein